MWSRLRKNDWPKCVGGVEAVRPDTHWVEMPMIFSGLLYLLHDKALLRHCHNHLRWRLDAIAALNQLVTWWEDTKTASVATNSDVINIEETPIGVSKQNSAA